MYTIKFIKIIYWRDKNVASSLRSQRPQGVVNGVNTVNNRKLRQDNKKRESSFRWRFFKVF
ncbi:hypothetical protein AC231_02805 [Clostridium pasteurianum]|nr:hypothetical protein AQ983_08645 [Clostridium pasteurianum DSM 525 = ATCC 6013]AOZ78939.1 hypothetical protein AQ984_08635 [Clostridium pasteurianum]ELP59755.1 hypothetical protein F502_07818 [Clostridium pasteurianum DSM 525 = ATCC 6013]OMH22597.1 hypothetical protein AC231_02805 [Clostridium pasteurianum]